jgi:hypothetical protein
MVAGVSHARRRRPYMVAGVSHVLKKLSMDSPKNWAQILGTKKLTY